MNYRIDLSPMAMTEIDDAYSWISQRSRAGAVKWYNKLDKAIQGLQTHPEQQPLAPESQFFIEKIRQLIVGNKRYGYRVLYTVSGGVVHVHHVRHGRQSPLNKYDLSDVN